MRYKAAAAPWLAAVPTEAAPRQATQLPPGAGRSAWLRLAPLVATATGFEVGAVGVREGAAEGERDCGLGGRE
jgi:hypothetical protein